jgi:hypothetical protein
LKRAFHAVEGDPGGILFVTDTDIDIYKERERERERESCSVTCRVEVTYSAGGDRQVTKPLPLG